MRNITVFAGLFIIHGLSSHASVATVAIDSRYGSHDFNDLCTALAAYEGKGEAAYVEGVDATGRPVASADLNSSQQSEPERLYIPITIDLADRFGLNLSSGLEADALVGILYLDGDVLYYNDEKISDAQSHAIATECARSRKTP